MKEQHFPYYHRQDRRGRTIFLCRWKSILRDKAEIDDWVLQGARIYWEMMVTFCDRAKALDLWRYGLQTSFDLAVIANDNIQIDHLQ